ncbi:MAG: hypothetical protein AB1673_16495 [Actinomycetota bacterium]
MALIPSPGEWVADKFADGAKAIFEWFLRRLGEALGNAADKIVSEVMSYLDHSSGVALTEGWFASPRTKEILGAVAVFASALMLLFLLVAIVQGVLAGDVGLMLRSAALEVPASVLGMVALTAVASVMLAAVDGLSSAVIAAAPDNLGRFLSFGEPEAIVKLGLLGFMIIPVFILGAMLVWVELVVRSSLIYLLVAFAPIILAARVWPMLRGAWHHFLRIAMALIVAKFAIALALGLGASALAGGGPGNLGSPGPNPNDLGGQVGLTVQGAVVGTALILMAAISPFMVLKLLPVFEAAVVAQGISRGPARAAQTGMQGAYYAQGLKRLAGSSSRPAQGAWAPSPNGPGPANGGPVAGAAGGGGPSGAGGGAGGAAAGGAALAGVAGTGVAASATVAGAGAANVRAAGTASGQANGSTRGAPRPVGAPGDRRGQGGEPG